MDILVNADVFQKAVLGILLIFVPFFLFGYIASVVEPVKKYLKFRCMRHGKNLFFFAGLEHLAQLEHDRWNAYMRIAGWIRLPLEKTTKKLRKISGVKYILEWSKER